MGDTVVYTREMVWHWLRNRQSYLWLGASIRPDDKLGVRAPKAEEAVHCRRSELNGDMALAMLRLDPRERDLLLIGVSLKYSTFPTRSRGDHFDEVMADVFGFERPKDYREARDRAIDRMAASANHLDELVRERVSSR